MSRNIVIGIEGLVGAGKTTMCRDLLDKIPNSILFNGGNLYRTIVYVLMNSAKDKKNIEKKMKNVNIKEIMDILGVQLKIENRETKMYVNNIPIKEENIQSKEASLAVSKVGGIADNTKLFEFAKNLIEEIGKEHHIILSGRALPKIYPNLDYHFFITASLEERVRRKCIQYNTTEEKKEIEENIRKRDILQEKAGFYKLTEKTIVIDVTNCRSVAEANSLLLEHVKIPENII